MGEKKKAGCSYLIQGLLHVVNVKVPLDGVAVRGRWSAHKSTLNFVHARTHVRAIIVRCGLI